MSPTPTTPLIVAIVSRASRTLRRLRRLHVVPGDAAARKCAPARSSRLSATASLECRRRATVRVEMSATFIEVQLQRPSEEAPLQR